MKRRVIKYICGSLLVLFIIFTMGILFWTSNTYQPTNELLSEVKSEDYINEGDFLVFNPKGEDKKTALVLYPGALVEPLAYGYYANELSKEGYTVAIPEVALNLSITENDKAEEFIINHSEIENWYVGGHSMGGVSAAMFAEERRDIVKGLILLGSYPSESTNLSNNNIRVLSLYAEHDGLTSLEEIDESKDNLPTEAVFAEIKGGNHAQFGMYGEQKNDNKADITNIEQQKIMAQMTLSFLVEK